MYPWIPWELVADLFGSAERTLGTTGLMVSQPVVSVTRHKVLITGYCSLSIFRLNFKKPASYIYIGRAYRYPPNVAFYIFFSTNISTEYFKHATHSPFFSSKCRLFYNATFFGSCIIHILHTGRVKI